MLGFTIELERIAEVIIMAMVGNVLATLAAPLFTWQALALVIALFMFVRPASRRVVVDRLGRFADAAPPDELVRDSRRGLVLLPRVFARTRPAAGHQAARAARARGGDCVGGDSRGVGDAAR